MTQIAGEATLANIALSAPYAELTFDVIKPQRRLIRSFTIRTTLQAGQEAKVGKRYAVTITETA